MFPVILSFGPITIYSLQVMIVVAVFFGLFAFWRKTKEEHYDEMMVFDGVLMSLLVGFLLARAVFIVTFFSRFGFNVLSWIDIFSHPGFNLSALFAGSALYLYHYSQEKKWDAYEILDFWSVGMSISLAIIWFGYWLSGIGFGTATNLPVGMVFTGLLETHHPIQLYYVVFFVVLAWFLSWVEYRYRTFRWYRGHKNTAQTGFLISVMALASGWWALLLLPITIAPSYFFGIRLDALLAVAMLLGGAYLLHKRSGQNMFKNIFKK
jgi:prolipoprotein diacylglyceryltransferase